MSAVSSRPGLSPDPRAMTHWLRTMALMRRYFRYEVEGIETLATHACKVVVGYHGRPIAYDLFLLGAEIHRRQGYLPLAVVHRNFMRAGYSRWLTEGLEWCTGRGPEMEAAAQTGRHIILAPGGSVEGLRPGWVRGKVDWGGHLGYLRFAIRRGLGIVPAAAAGADDTYFGLCNGHELGRACRQHLGFEPRAPLWLGLGPLGLWPWSPPFPVRMHQVLGPELRPEDYAGVDHRDDAALRELHVEIQGRVQTALDLAQARLSRERGAAWRTLAQDLSPLR